MTRTSTDRQYKPKNLERLAQLIKIIQGKKSGHSFAAVCGFSEGTLRNLKKGQGSGAPGNNVVSDEILEKLSKGLNLPSYVLEQLLLGNLSTEDILFSSKSDNSTLTNQVRIITQSISFADVCRLAKSSQICIQRLADIVEGCQINSWEVEAFSTFFSKAQSTLVTFPESGEDSSDVIRCKVKMTTLADLIKAELERRQMSVEDLAEIIGTDLMSVEQLKELKEGKLADEDQVDLIFRYLVNPKTKKPFKKPDELLQFLINPDWTPKTNNNSSNGFCNHSC